MSIPLLIAAAIPLAIIAIVVRTWWERRFVLKNVAAPVSPEFSLEPRTPLVEWQRVHYALPTVRRLPHSSPFDNPTTLAIREYICLYLSLCNRLALH
jgi:hypothetical protein